MRLQTDHQDTDDTRWSESCSLTWRVCFMRELRDGAFLCTEALLMLDDY
jgi:hypothetical protein